jgi:hypothetical protein
MEGLFIQNTHGRYFYIHTGEIFMNNHKTSIFWKLKKQRLTLSLMDDRFSTISIAK